MNDDSIIRVQKTERYSVISNAILEDKRLSYKAKGILVYLLTKPNDWKARIRDISNNSTDGRDSVLSGIRELKECGYIEQVKRRDKHGKIFATETVIREEPLHRNPPNQAKKPETDNPVVGNSQKKPQTGFPDTDNPVVESIYILNTDLVNTDVVNSEDTINNGLFSDGDFDEPEPQPKPKSKRLQFNADDMQLAALLQNLIFANDPAAKKLDPQATIGEISKVRRLDKREVSEIRAVIEFSQRSKFWRQHILNGEKLREHYPKLRLKMIEETENAGKQNGKRSSGYNERLNYRLDKDQLTDAANIAGNYFSD